MVSLLKMRNPADRSWRLLPSEQTLWQGGPVLGVPRDYRWIVIPGLLFAFSAVTALFSGLLWVADLPATAIRSTVLTACYLILAGAGIALVPKYLLDPCEYLVTDRQVIWRRGPLRRAMERRAITYARIHWHRSVSGVGHLELVSSIPFGPLLRKQRLLLHDVQSPDRLFAIIRQVEPTEHAGYADVKLTDRLDRGEVVVWGAAPAGWRLGFAELMTAIMGMTVMVAGLFYIYRISRVLADLEAYGLFMRTWTWFMLFLAMVISGSVILAIGVVLLWKGLWGARADGSNTEYILTDTRLLIRRDRTELSIDRKYIVDVAEVPSTAGSRNLHLILDGPHGKALDDNGALSIFSALPRAAVPPVLYEVQDSELVRRLLLGNRYRPSRKIDDEGLH
jgi:hypothetical protein